jgi:hypothetical protein
MALAAYIPLSAPFKCDSYKAVGGKSTKNVASMKISCARIVETVELICANEDYENDSCSRVKCANKRLFGKTKQSAP